MANSSDVVMDETATALQYNNLRLDVLDIISGHDHDGVASKALNAQVKMDIRTRYWTCGVFHGATPTDELYAENSYEVFKNTDGTFAERLFFASLELPHGAIITKLSARIDREEGVGVIDLIRRNGIGGYDVLAQIVLASTSGLPVDEETTTITNPTVDNYNAYSYFISLRIDNVNATDDIQILRVKVEYTITDPLP